MTDYIRGFKGEGSALDRSDAQRVAEKLQTQATIVDGIIRWNSNKQIPPIECVALAVHMGLPVDETACTRTRDAETTAFLADYRKSRSKRGLSAEERSEMRAAFGPGKTVVNVITGRKHRT